LVAFSRPRSAWTARRLPKNSRSALILTDNSLDVCIIDEIEHARPDWLL
jgi:hypothetical protein